MARRKYEPSELDRARDELFGLIHRCGVIQATEPQQLEWMEDTLKFMAERYPVLASGELEQLRLVGLRFCRPAIPHGRQPVSSDNGANAA